MFSTGVAAVPYPIAGYLITSPNSTYEANDSFKLKAEQVYYAILAVRFMKYLNLRCRWAEAPAILNSNSPKSRATNTDSMIFGGANTHAIINRIWNKHNNVLSIKFIIYKSTLRPSLSLKIQGRHTSWAKYLFGFEQSMPCSTPPKVCVL